MAGLPRLPDAVITRIANLSGASGVLRDPCIPSQCRKGVPKYQEHRREWMGAVDLYLRAQGKEIARARWLMDGWFVDWRQIQSPPASPTLAVTSRYVQPSSIGRAALNPVDLTLLNDLDSKESGDEQPAPRDIKVEAPDNQHDFEANRQIFVQENTLQAANALLPEQTCSISESQRALLLPNNVSTGLKRRPDDYRYVRVDCPASLQLHRVPAIKTNHSHHGPYPRSVSKRSTQTNSLHLGRRPLEDQTQLFRAAMMSRSHEDLSVVSSIDWRRDIRQEYVTIPDQSIPSTGASMDCIVASEVGLALVSGEPQSSSSQVVTNEALFVEDERVPIISQDEDTNMVVYSEEVTTASSSDSEHDSIEIDRPTNSQPSETLPQADFRRALDLLASINHTSIKEILEQEPSSPIAPAKEINGFTKAIRSQPSTSKSLKSGKSVEHGRVARSALSTDGKVKSVPRGGPKKPKVFINYDVGETIALPKPEYSRARRLLNPVDGPLIHVSMPGDVQFVRGSDRSHRVRIERWSLPAPARLKGSSQGTVYNVSDACLLDQSRSILVHGSGPHAASIIELPKDEALPQRYNLSHSMVPIRGAQERDILASVCAIDSSRFITGGMDRRVLLWNLDMSTSYPKITIKSLSVGHSASVKALVYASSRRWLVSAAGSKLAITDMAENTEFMATGRQKWASNGIYNLHVHDQDDNLLLVETGDLDKQARIYDLRTIHTGTPPAALLGSTETSSISQYWRGDWEKSLVVRPSHGNIVKVWDIRRPNEPVSMHTLKHGVTHSVFINGGHTIAATGEHFITFLEA